MNHLELFSGTHSFGKVSKGKGYTVYSLDRDLGASCPFSDYVSENHIKEDIMTWDYKKIDCNYFQLITASPTCLWWSNARSTWLGRMKKSKIFTLEDLRKDIDEFGKPMVDKVFEIIEYFRPAKWIIENPHSSRMKYYIEERWPQYNTYNDFSYCKFSDWGYEKKTRFWNNLNKTSCICQKDCANIIKNGKQRIHRIRMGASKTVFDDGNIIRVNSKEQREKYRGWENIDNVQTSKLQRYRIPENIIDYLIA